MTTATQLRIKLNVAYPETRRMPLDYAIVHVRSCSGWAPEHDAHDGEDEGYDEMRQREADDNG